MEKDSILYVLTKSKEFLEQKKIPNPRLDSEVLLSDLLNLPRIKLYSNFDRKLDEDEKNAYRDRIKKRGEFTPVSHLTNKKEFYKSNFFINEKVLIPRPETEELVEWFLKEDLDNKKVLDLCTGSGCIGISIKLEKPNSEIYFSDISMEAIEIAKKNFLDIIQKDEFHFLKSDLFQEIDSKFDFIITNPPYISPSEKEFISKEVLDFEPHLALFVDDFVSFHKKILEESKKCLNPNGKIYLETNPNFINQLVEISKEYFTSYEIKKDYSNKERFVKFFSLTE